MYDIDKNAYEKNQITITAKNPKTNQAEKQQQYKNYKAVLLTICNSSHSVIY